jgi:hypothetical protein
MVEFGIRIAAAASDQSPDLDVGLPQPRLGISIRPPGRASG